MCDDRQETEDYNYMREYSDRPEGSSNLNDIAKASSFLPTLVEISSTGLIHNVEEGSDWGLLTGGVVTILAS